MATLDRQTLAEHSAHELAGLATAIAGELNVKLDDLLQNVEVIAALSDITAMDPTRQRNLLKELFLHYDQFSSLDILNLSGELLASSQPNRVPVIQPEALRAAADQGRQTWQITTDPNDGQRVLLIYTPIRNADRQIVGVIAGTINLFDLVSAVEKVRAGNARAFVIDETGHVLLHADPGKMQVAEAGPWLAAFEAKRLVGTGTTSYEVNAESYLAGYTTLIDFNWTVLVERPEAEVVALAQQGYYLTLVALLLTTVLVLLTSWGLTRWLTRPVSNLAAAARAFTSGDPTAPLPAITEKHGELGVLVAAFRDMRTAVTEREAALRKSEAHNRALLNAIPDTMLLVSPTGSLKECKLGVKEELVGFSSESVGQPMADICPPEMVQKAMPLVQQVWRNPAEVQRLECQLPTVHDTRNDYEARFVASGADEVLIMLRNITTQKRAEEQLRLMQSVVLNATESVLITEVGPIDQPGPKIIYVNEAFTKMTGYAAHEVIGQTPRILQGPRTDRRQLDKIRAAMTEWRPSRAEVINYHKDGTEFWVDFTITPLKNEHGWVTHWVSVQRDVTERKRAEEMLRALVEGTATVVGKDFFNSLVRHLATIFGARVALAAELDSSQNKATTLAVWIEGTLGQNFTYDLAGTPCGEIVAAGETIYYPSQLQAHFPQVDLLASLQAESYLGIPLFGSTGHLLGHLAVIDDKPMQSRPGELSLLKIFAARAATELERQHIEADLQLERASLAQRVTERTTELSAANAELARANRLKDEFLAAVSHELRTPLNAILGMSEALEEQVYGPLNQDQLEAVGEVVTSGRHLLELINDILDLSKIEAGKMELDIGPVSIQSVCQASLRMIKQTAWQKQLKVMTTFDQEVTEIKADERRLKQILVNLLSNAVKFTPTGGQVGLEVLGDESRAVVEFTVWDTGIGISPDDLPRLFQPFVQLDSRLSRRYVGTGLGLALVYRLTALHAGSVTVESQVGQGSRFTISLPWSEIEEKNQAADLVSDPLPPIEIKPPWVDGATTQPTILIAEDNEANIRTLAAYLRRKGYHLLFARNGVEAVQQARAERPSLILMDIQMPEMDGLEATRRLRADPDLATMPIIAVTALAMPGDRERCLAAGANEYLSKPVNLSKLVQMIEVQLKRAPQVE